MSDPFSNANHNKNNSSIEERTKAAQKDMELRRDAASAPKAQKPPEKPFIPSKPFWVTNG